jgi:hypothetical protein
VAIKFRGKARKEMTDKKGEKKDQGEEQEKPKLRVCNK